MNIFTELKFMNILPKQASTDSVVPEPSEVLSHEIRNPLNGIMGYVWLLDNTNLNDEQREFVTGIKRSSDQMLRILENILHSNIINHRFQKKSYFTIYELLENVVYTLKSLFIKKKIELLVDFNHEGDFKFDGDFTGLFQLLVNLMSNSLKFTEKGFVELKVYTSQVNDSIVEVIFVVGDTGRGIEKDQIGRIFQPYYQEQYFSGVNSEGVGLGLSVVKKITDEFNGRIQVNSHVGIGSVFTATVKLKTSVRTDEIKNDVINSNFFHKIFNSFKKILIVEDNDLNRFLLSKILDSTSYIVITASNFETAKKYFDLFHFDLVVTDYFLQDGIGTDLINEIDSKSIFRTKFLLLTAYENINTEVKLKIDVILKKPADPEFLLKQIEHLLNKC
ncbi:MAG: ATP-binding protein [Bacteroidota bacterium]|jgi:CheY-like chemotaxis protein